MKSSKIYKYNYTKYVYENDAAPSAVLWEFVMKGEGCTYISRCLLSCIYVQTNASLKCYFANQNSKLCARKYP